MAKKGTISDPEQLRKKAESRLRYEKIPVLKGSREETAKTLHELHVHQLELEMQNEELRRAQAELEVSRSRYADLFDFAPVGYFILDAKGIILEVNLTGTDIIGIERQKLVKRPFVLCVSKEDRDTFYLHRRQVFRDHSRCCELRMLNRKHGEFYAELRMEPVKDPSGQVIRCRMSVTDITERKQMEQMLEAARMAAVTKKKQLETVLETLPTGVAILDAGGGNIYSNRVYEEVWGSTDSSPRPSVSTIRDYASYKAWWVDSGKPVKPEEWASALAAKKGETVTDQLMEIERFDGRHAFVLNSSSPIFDAEGRLSGCVVVIRDITPLRRTEQALRESQERLTLAQQAAGAGIWDWDMIAGTVDWSPNLFRLFGLDPEKDQASFDSWRKMLHPEERGLVQERIEQAVRDRTQLKSEYRILLPDGSIRWILALGNTVYDKQDRAVRMSGICLDITDRIEREQRIRSTARFPEENPFPVLRIAGDGQILYSNPPGTALLDQWGRQVGQKAPDEWCTLAARCLQSEQYLVEEAECGPKVFSFALAPVVEDGYANLYGRDITAQKRSQETLHRNQQRFMLLSETASRLLRVKDPRPIVDSLCRQVMEFLDCHAFFYYLIDEKKEQLHLNACAGVPDEIAKSITWLNYGTAVCGCVARDGKPVIAANIPGNQDPQVDLIRSFGITAYACHPLITQDRVIGTLSFGSRTKTAFSREDLAVMKTIADQVASAMERIRAEEAIRQSARQVRDQLAEIESIYNTAFVGLCVLSRDLRYLRVNQHMAEMHGVPMEEHIGKTMREVIPELAGRAERIAKKVLRTGESVLDIEISGMTKADPGVLHHWKQQWLPIKDDNGRVTAINMVAEDVTERKHIEQSLLEINQVLGKQVRSQSAELSRTIHILQEEVTERVRAQRNLQESSRVLDAFFAHTITPLVILDRKFNFVRVNRAYADACQREVPEFEGHNHFELYPHEENEKIFKRVVRTRRAYQAVAKPFSYPDHPEWGVTYWDWSLVPILGRAGKVEFLVFALREVTQRIRMELELKQSEEKYRRLVEVSPETVCVLAEEKVAFINQAGVKLMKAEKAEELIGKSIWEFIHPDSAELARADLKRLCRNENVPSREIKLIRLDGSPVEVETSVTEIMHQEKRGLLVVFHDITERKKAEQVLKAERKRLEEVLEMMPAYAVLVRPDYHIAYANRVFTERFGADHGKKCHELMFQKDKPCESCRTFRVLKTGKPQMWEWSGPDGRTYDVYDYPFMDWDGSPLAMEVGVDVTAHKRAQQALQESELRLLEAQRLAHLGNWDWDIVNNRFLWSDEVYRIFGLPPQQKEAGYEAFMNCVHPEDRKRFETAIDQSLYEGTGCHIDHRILRPDGSERVVLEQAEVTYDAEHRPVKMVGTVYDVTEQRKAEEEIRRNQQTLRTMAAELQLAEERERRRIAQDLHDSIGQILAFSSRELRTLRRYASEKVGKSLLNVSSELDKAVEQSRTLSFDLSPSILYDLGFEVAVEDLVDRFSRERRIPCRFENCALTKPLAEDVKILLYRSIRELMLNAVKHAQPGQIRVVLHRSSSDIYVKVEDDGAGFDPSKLTQAEKSHGFGLFNIRERLGHIGGLLKIESEKGKGTKAILIAPLDLEKEE